MFDDSKFQILYFPNYNLDNLIAFSKELSENMFFKVFENLKKTFSRNETRLLFSETPCFVNRFA